MAEDIKIKGEIIRFMEQDTQREYTTPDIQNGIGVRNREHAVVALRELELEKRVASRKKGRVPYYHLITAKME